MRSATRKATSISARSAWNSDRTRLRGSPTLVGLDLCATTLKITNHLLLNKFPEISVHTLTLRMNVISNTLYDILPAARKIHGTEPSS